MPNHAALLLGVALVIVVAVAAWVMLHDRLLRQKFAPEPPRPLVLVVGGGLAGLVAAVTLSTRATVVVADAAASVGGNSVRAKSGMARPTEDTEAKRGLMLDDLVASARLRDRDELDRARRLVNEATAAHDWVREVLGVRLCKANQTAGQHEARTFCTEGAAPVGAALVDAAASVARARGVRVCTSARLEDVALDDDAGCVVATFALADGHRRQQRCDALVVATGGYAHPQSELLRNAAPHLCDLPTTNANSSAAGGAVQLLLKRRLGAALRGLECVQVHPTAVVDPKRPDAPNKELLAEAVRGMGARLVDEGGRRFVDELKPRDEVVEAMRRSGSARFFVVLPAAVAADPLVRQYAERGLALPAAESPLPDAEPGSLVVQVVPALHYTMGGLAVDLDGRVLRERDGAPVPGVVAAGECTGGLHGKNRLAGNSLLECVVYGRVAARTAFEYAAPRARGLQPTLCAAAAPQKPAPPPTVDVAPETLAGHNTQASAWLAIRGTVYDVTAYLARHPHGAQVIVDVLGKDVTVDFERLHHSPDKVLRAALDDGSVKAVGRLVQKK